MARREQEGHWLMWFFGLFVFVLLLIPMIANGYFFVLIILAVLLGGFKLLSWSENPHNRRIVISDTGRHMPQRRRRNGRIPLNQNYKANSFDRNSISKFCYECGMRLTVGSKFCGGCGTTTNL